MKVLGIDPGLANTGWSIVEPFSENSFTLCDIGIIKTDKRNEFEKRLVEITDSLRDVALAHKIKYVAFEDIFFTKNVSSAIEVAKVIGSFSYCFANMGIKSYFYTPTKIKQMITGGGKADKKFIQKMVDMQLSDNKFVIKTDHEYDSIAAAMTFFLELKATMVSNMA